MTKNKIDWSKVPTTKSSGYVNYQKIPSAAVRLIVAESEIIKLENELKAIEQWHDTPANRNRIKQLQTHINWLDRFIREYKTQSLEV